MQMTGRIISVLVETSEAKSVEVFIYEVLNMIIKAWLEKGAVFDNILQSSIFWICS